MLTPIVMAGGTGSRLWPMSRELYPKQFLKLYGDNSMLQETLLRLKGFEINEPIVICNEQHRFIVAEQLRKIDSLSQNIILEPAGRNTAPAITLAAIKCLSNNEDPLLLVLAADHVIENVNAFHSSIETAIPYAEKGKLVTFGIVPTGPETGYGYIQRGMSVDDSNSSAFDVKRFVEKPLKEIAEQYLETGEYYWNSGMFLFRASRFLDEIKKHRPDILTACKSAMQGQRHDSNQDFIRVEEEAFLACPDESVDYAVMENTEHAVVVPLDAGWNDVGSWSALWEINNKDKNNNVLLGDIFTENSSDCYISSSESLVAAVGVNNLVIINTKDALLIIDKSKVQDVKAVVQHLKENNRHEHKVHKETYRPWGYVDKIVKEERYHVNKVVIAPGGKFSLQKHHHRAEHWVVLSGTANITLNDKQFLLTENESTFIPIGATHMLENPGLIPLEILEIQSGDYLEDNDIVRIKDHYGNN